jgi:hypothetical protein
MLICWFHVCGRVGLSAAGPEYRQATDNCLSVAMQVFIGFSAGRALMRPSCGKSGFDWRAQGHTSNAEINGADRA